MRSVFLLINSKGEVELDEAYTDESIVLLKIAKLKQQYEYVEVPLVGLQKVNARQAEC